MADACHDSITAPVVTAVSTVNVNRNYASFTISQPRPSTRRQTNRPSSSSRSLLTSAVATMVARSMVRGELEEGEGLATAFQTPTTTATAAAAESNPKQKQAKK